MSLATMDGTPTTLAARLRSARRKTNLSARALSLRAGISHALVGMIERGSVTNPRGETLRKLAATLGVSLAWLMTGDEESRPSNEAA